MSWIEALILGVIQGLTEFLPVSSSGHLEIGAAILQVKSEENLLFAVMVHFATALATIVVFREDIATIIKEVFKLEWNESTQFIVKIIISMMPVFVVGVFFKDEIESLFTSNLVLVGSMLIITSGLLFFSGLKKSGASEVSFVHALVIGLAQALAVLPGISRSGSTIATALLLGVDRTQAARFSFLMVLIPILGASLLELKDFVESPVAHDITLLSLLVGFIAAFISGYVACRWMLKIVRSGKLIYFAAYCLVVGIIAITFA